MSKTKKKTKKKYNKLERNENIMAYIFLAPTIFYLLFWTILPILSSFFMSFTNYDMINHNILKPFSSGIEFVGLTNYKLTLNNQIFKVALSNTATYAFFAVFSTTFMGLMLALIAHSAKGKNFFRVAYYIPTVTAIAALIIIFDGMFRPGTLVTDFLAFFGVPIAEWRTSSDFALPLAIIMSVWVGMGYSMLIYLAGLQEISNDVYEAASLDSAPKFKQFIYITFPLLNNKTFFLLATGFIGAFQVFESLQMLAEYGDAPLVGGPGDSLWSVVYYVYYVGWMQNKMGRASAVSFILLIIIIIFTFIQRKIFKDQTY